MSFSRRDEVHRDCLPPPRATALIQDMEANIKNDIGTNTSIRKTDLATLEDFDYNLAFRYRSEILF